MICVDGQGLAASRPNRALYSDVSVTVSTGDRLAVVGLNGCGKSTLLRVLAGVAEPESGVVRFGRGVRIGHLAQEPDVPAGVVADIVGARWHGVDASVDRWRGAAVVDRLGMGHLIDADTTTLSGGQRKRVALASLLAGEHDLLVLDEPTNHLDLDAIGFLEGWLANFAGALVLVTHDRHVLDRVTTEVLELDRGRAYLHVPRGEHAGSGYAAYLAGRVEREQQAATAEDVRRNLARNELAWLRRGAPARTAKPKARIASAKAIVEGGPQVAARSGDLDLGALGSSRLGSKVVELHGVGFAWPGVAKPVLQHVEHLIEPGDRLGVVGANGAGKTTLLDLLAGRLRPTHGRVERGATVRIGYYDQHGAELDPAMRVRDAVAGPHRPASHEDASLLARFWFDTDAQWAEIGTLSGGERRRLQLLLVLAEQPNLLLLDEPTNDLDLDTLRALEDHLETWTGALVVVSHDRTFLDRTVEEVLAIDDLGRAELVRGGFAGWLARRAASIAPGGAAGNAGTVTGTSGGRSQLVRSAEPTRTTRSPSTLRRLLTSAERDLAAASAQRNALIGELATAGADHRRMTELGRRLEQLDSQLAATEERWMTLAGEAEAAGLQL